MEDIEGEEDKVVADAFKRCYRIQPQSITVKLGTCFMLMGCLVTVGHLLKILRMVKKTLNVWGGSYKWSL